MKIQIQHILMVLVGAALPTLGHLIEGQPSLTLTVLGQDAVSALIVGVSAAMQGIFPVVSNK